jgi:hypothetical protein
MKRRFDRTLKLASPIRGRTNGSTLRSTMVIAALLADVATTASALQSGMVHGSTARNQASFPQVRRSPWLAVMTVPRVALSLLIAIKVVEPIVRVRRRSWAPGQRRVGTLMIDISGSDGARRCVHGLQQRRLACLESAQRSLDVIKAEPIADELRVSCHVGRSSCHPVSSIEGHILRRPWRRHDGECESGCDALNGPRPQPASHSQGPFRRLGPVGPAVDAQRPLKYTTYDSLDRTELGAKPHRLGAVGPGAAEHEAGPVRRHRLRGALGRSCWAAAALGTASPWLSSTSCTTETRSSDAPVGDQSARTDLFHTGTHHAGGGSTAVDCQSRRRWS